MKQQKNRRNLIIEFIADNKYDKRVRRLVQKSMLAEEEATTLTELIMFFVAFLGSTEEGNRVVY